MKHAGNVGALRWNFKKVALATCHLSPVTCDMTPATLHLSPVSCRLSPVTCQLLQAKCHLSPVSNTKIHINRLFLCYFYPTVHSRLFQKAQKTSDGNKI